MQCLTQLLSYVLFGVVEEAEVGLRQFIIVLFFGIYVSPKIILMKRFLKIQYAFRFFFVRYCKLFLSDWAIFQVEVGVLLFFPVSFSLIWFVGRGAQ